MPDSPHVAELRGRLQGDIVTPTDGAYEAARRVWNGMVDRRPGAIVYCASQQDVVEAVRYARDRDLTVAVRSGGHNVAGLSVCDGGLVIDLSRLKTALVDTARRTVRAGAGLTLGEFDAATQAHGLGTTMGVNSTTGIAGLTLGGGFGKLGRKYGLACDNLLAADIVTADGERLRTSATENPDMFWALRGGGGNFGIVTAFEYRLHPVGPSLLNASLVFGGTGIRDAMRAYDDLCRNAPDDISADAALARDESAGTVFAVSICHVGAADRAEAMVERTAAPLRRASRPMNETVRADAYLDIQAAGDAIFPRGDRYYWKAQFLPGVVDAAIDRMIDGFATAPSPRNLLVLQHVGGAIARVAPTETAYVNRDAACDCFPLAIWQDPREDAANIEWARASWEDLQPFSTGGVYVNNLGEEGEARVRDAYGVNHDRLVAVKRRYDPTNFFRLNQNIRPD